MAELEERNQEAEEVGGKAERPDAQNPDAQKPHGNAQEFLHKLSEASGKLKTKAVTSTVTAAKALKSSSLKVAEKTAKGAAKASDTLRNHFEKLQDLASEAREGGAKETPAFKENSESGEALENSAGAIPRAQRTEFTKSSSAQPERKSKVPFLACAATFIIGGIFGALLSEAVEPEHEELKEKIERQIAVLDGKYGGDWRELRETLVYVIDEYEDLVAELEGNAHERYPLETEVSMLYECLQNGDRDAAMLKISRSGYDFLSAECAETILELERQIPSVLEFKKARNSMKIVNGRSRQ